jgi:hypothetical protein
MKEIVGRDSAVGLGDDPLRGLAREPGAALAADQRHRAGRDANAARKVGAGDAVASEPVTEFHER